MDPATMGLILDKQNSILQRRIEYSALPADEQLRLADRGIYGAGDYVRFKNER